MRIIAHRANTDGPNPDTENSINQILTAIEQGFDVEIDTWVIDGKIYFGHDAPKYECSERVLFSIIEKSWFHCKNLQAMIFLPQKFPGIKYFWHQTDDYTITSNGYIWTYPGKKITSKSIMVLPELLDNKELNEVYTQNPYAICTDWPKSNVFRK